jgi:hypothetical protein
MTELSYQSPSPQPGRSWIRTLLLLVFAFPFLFFAVTLTVMALAFIALPSGVRPVLRDNEAGGGLFLWTVCAVLTFLLLNRADPYRTLSGPAPGEKPPPFTRLSKLAFATALVGLVPALAGGTACGILLRYAYFHHTFSFVNARRIYFLILFLLSFASAALAIMDVITATASPIRRRGYGIVCASLVLACALPFIFVKSADRASAIDAPAIRARYAEVQAIRDAAVNIPSHPPSSGDEPYIFPSLSPLTPRDVYAHGPLPPFDIIVAIRPKPLPAVPELWIDSSAGKPEYAYEGILVCFANGHTRVILPSDWPKTWAAHNAARAKISLPPQPDPLAPPSPKSFKP